MPAVLAREKVDTFFCFDQEKIEEALRSAVRLKRDGASRSSPWRRGVSVAVSVYANGRKMVIAAS
jgi:hypothetical protein